MKRGVTNELIRSCVESRAWGLSPKARRELEQAVTENLESFCTSPREQALLRILHALEEYNDWLQSVEHLDDASYLSERDNRLGLIRHACTEALFIDKDCLLASIVRVLAEEAPAWRTLKELISLEKAQEAPPPYLEAQARFGQCVAVRLDKDGNCSYCENPDFDQEDLNLGQLESVDYFMELNEDETAVGNYAARSWMRLQFSIMRAAFDCMHYKLAKRYAWGLIRSAPHDPLGARHTLALIYARLEDEKGLQNLDKFFSRKGSGWMRLAQAILSYKLNRLPAAKRAIQGFIDLGEGAAFSLLCPSFLEPYLPDRPEVEANSMAETHMTVFEADDVLADVPNFINMVSAIPGVYVDAKAFAERNDLEFKLSTPETNLRDWIEQIEEQGGCVLPTGFIVQPHRFGNWGDGADDEMIDDTERPEDNEDEKPDHGLNEPTDPK